MEGYINSLQHIECVRTPEFKVTYWASTAFAGIPDPWKFGYSVRIRSCDALSLLQESSFFKVDGKTLPLLCVRTRVKTPQFVIVPTVAIRPNGTRAHRRYVHALGFSNWEPSSYGIQVASNNVGYDPVVGEVTRSCLCGALKWIETISLHQLVYSKLYTLRLLSEYSRIQHGPTCRNARDEQRVTVTARYAIKVAANDSNVTAQTLSGQKLVPIQHDNSPLSMNAAGGKPHKLTCNTLHWERRRIRGGLPPFEAVHTLLTSAVKNAESTGMLDTFSVIAYRPAKNPGSTSNKWSEHGWFVLVEMPKGSALLQQYGPTTGECYDMISNS